MSIRSHRFLAALILPASFLIVPLALAQTANGSSGAVKTMCKAGYSYLVMPTSAGVSVRATERVDCRALDAQGVPVNQGTRECREKVGDIYWDCREGLTEGTYKCEHKTCKEGDVVSGPSSAVLPPKTAGSPAVPAGENPAAEPSQAPLPPISRQSVLEALQHAPLTLSQDTASARSTAADNFERSMLEAGLAPGSLVPGTGGAQRDLPLQGAPSASDAVQLQGGTFSQIPASQTQLTQDSGGTGPNTFAPTDFLQPDSQKSATWEDRVSAFLGCTVGYFFGGCDAAQAEGPDQRKITILTVTPSGAQEIPASLFSTEDGASPIGDTRPPADIDTLTPAQLKEIEERLSAQRSERAHEEEARSRFTVPKSPVALQNAIFAGLFKAIGGGGMEDLWTAWEEAAVARSDAERAHPIEPVAVAELPPIPGATDGASAAPPPSPEAPETEALPPTAPSPAFTIDPKVDAQVREAFEAQKQSARSLIWYTEDLLARSGTTATEAAAQGALDLANARYEAIAAEQALYESGSPSPALRSAIEQLSAGSSEGSFARSFTSFADAAHKLSADTSKEMQVVYNDPAEVIGGLADGAIVLGSGFAGGVAEGLRNFATKAGVPGFEDDPKRALIDAVDPYKKYGQTGLDAVNVAPFAYGLYTIGKAGVGAVADMLSPAGIVARDLGVVGELSTVERLASTEIEGVIASGGRAADDVSRIGRPFQEIPGAVVETPAVRLPPAANIDSEGFIPGSASDSVSPFGRVSASPAIEPEVDNLSMKAWTGGAGVTAGILCLGFCPSSELPPRDVSVELVPLSKEDLALLFPRENEAREAPVPQGTVVPSEVSVESPPLQAPPPLVDSQQTQIQSEQPAAQPLPPVAAPPVLAAPPDGHENDAVPPPAGVESVPELGTLESRRLFEEQKRQVEARSEEQRQKNREALEAWDEAQRQKTKELQEQISRLQRERVDMNMPSPAIVSSDAPQASAPGTQGVGPLTPDQIASGLQPDPAGAGATRKDLEINFELGSARLLKDGREQVAALAQVMSRDEFRNSTFTIVGHTDTVGTPESNLILSRQRAQAIVNMLNRDYGIPLSQMQASGAGQWALKVPILGNVAANRRVEVIVATRR